MTTRLTNDMRATIANNCIEAQFKQRKTEIAEEENALGLALYEHVFDEKIRSAAKKIPKGWARMDECLRFNCNGLDLTFSVKEPIPVPHSSYCSRLGSVTGELAEKASEFAVKKDALRNEEREARRALSQMLSGFGSIKQLDSAWPEGRAFYSRYLEPAKGSSVPAVQVEAINEMLGLKAA